MKKVIITTAIIILSFNLYSQVGGLSASKLATICTAPVPENMIEFEPAFGFTYSNEYYNEDGIVESRFGADDSLEITSNLGFRFSYGLMENLEIGMLVPFDANSFSIGLKYKMFEKDNFSLGLMTGYNSTDGNRIINRSILELEDSPAIAGGLIVTYDFSDKLSMDFDAQYQQHINTTDEMHKSDVFLNSDIGYFVTDGVQLVLGMNYFNSAYEDVDLNSNLLTMNVGITLEKADNFILVANAPIDIFGQNNYKSTGFGLALTIIID